MRDVSKARGFNTFLSFLIVVQATFLLIIASLLIAPLISPEVSVLSAIATAFLFLLCIPLSIYLYRTSANKVQKALYLSLSITYSLLAAACLLWFFFPHMFRIQWVIPAGKIVGIAVYLPVLLIFLQLVREKKKAIKPDLYNFIVIFNVISAVSILLFVAMNYYAGGGHPFNVFIFTAYILLDVIILSLGSMLIVTCMENQLRYILLVPVSFFLFSLAGDVLNLLAYLGLYDTITYPQYFYNGMSVLGGLILFFIALRNVKVTTVEEMDKELYDVRRLMSDLVLQSPDAICIFDMGGKAVQANNAFIRLMGKSQNDVIGKLDLFHDVDPFIKGASEKMAEIRNGDIAFYEGVVPILAVTGQNRYYRVKAFPTHGSDGAATSYIVMMADVTDSKNKEEELKAAKNEAELYLDLMSHDINNMDQIAMGFLEIALSRPDVNEEVKELISRPFGALESSSSLIRNVTKLQQVKGNGLKLYAVSPGEMLHDAIRGFSNIPGREVTITERIDGDSKVMANGLLSDVFTNLIGNAIKHSDGRIAISVHMDTFQDNGADYCRIRIEDDGPGIPDERKLIIFNRLQKGSARAGGKGLGLYLVKTLVETFHGKVWIEDRIAGDSGKGSRFVVMLPLCSPI